MKTLGILGGMSWESTAHYYALINRGIKQRLGGLHSAKILLHSVDFAEIEALQASGDWAQAGEMLAKAGLGLQKAGADALLIATNTMHKVADAIEAQCDLQLLHIADATGRTLIDDGVTRVGLLGTRYTMEQDFYKGRLTERFGLEVRIPNADGINEVNRVIYDELCLGEIKDSSRQSYQAIVADLAEQGCQAVILGCTEIGLLLKPQDCDLPLYDTTEIHAKAAVEFALASD
ncbi:aspartate/glutamate racemase family protein [Paraferrimonas sedimenticola]|uniref:Aspartate racemase n=1 Tax=Paraferrimonas sedimenticola TaxID=375674 RepID=A0AA37RVA0_9GAMM|nr:amino acid racemase [Paraferrimonas sedimenticola]GLP95866.1 hypothetical protein GCM10007895_11720 [Paraferrimonas sedimenticola]